MSARPPVADQTPIKGEVFRAIDGFDGYEVSDYGRVRSNGRILAPRIHSNGYHRITLCRKGRAQRDAYVHRLVLMAFVGAPQGDEQADHIDGNRVNNNSSNLRWLSVSANLARRAMARGDEQGAAKLSADQIPTIRAALAAGQVDAAVARDHGVGRKTISDIRTGKTWRHIQ